MRERTGSSWATVSTIVVVLATTVPVAGSSQGVAAVQAQHGRSMAPAASPASPRPVAVSASSTFDRIQEQLTWRRKRLAQVAQQERWALAQLSGAQERLERAVVHLNQTTAALAGTQRAVQGAARSLAAVTTRLAMHERLMGTRVRGLLRKGSCGVSRHVARLSGFP
jgi:hypothetical protein